ncbi:hypothetical protein CBR_g12378 [Chara braunii]|uniref:Uncharacterized protein n=1 Tax=Chara braunii TaxID=69332 RepID=A0A388KRX0_CHABU|nr:hypothetical protein CBR_g12378 [Chara braunii]|eukprot:GBG72811.1 hypothetical protein CBR_g12378 [Chara braunii]
MWGFAAVRIATESEHRLQMGGSRGGVWMPVRVGGMRCRIAVLLCGTLCSRSSQIAVNRCELPQRSVTMKLPHRW